MPSVFICHASEDKEAIARPLAHALRERHVDVWYDEFSLTVGQGLMASIDKGLAQADYGVVVVSPAFFQKRWTQRELSGLVARQMAGAGDIILPVWHDIDRDSILAHSPPLADVVAAASSAGIDDVVERLLRAIRLTESPLVIARNRLADLGVGTPSVADDWWIDLTELKQSIFAEPDCKQRWIFPLPSPHENHAYDRGANLASTALQLDWCYAAKDRDLCQFTHPDILHAFLRAHPGLMETARANPGTLAMYVPQLTLPEFDTGFADVFDALLDPARVDANESVGYGGWKTVDGEKPACGELIAWRHPTFGGLTHRHLAYSFVNRHDHHYSRRSHSTLDCATWLLADESSWLPRRIASPLVEGFTARHLWINDVNNFDNPLIDALYRRSRKTFRLTRTVRAGAEELFGEIAAGLGLLTPAATIVDRFVANGFIDGWYDGQERMAELRKKRR